METQERKDNWSTEDDTILAEIVLKHIREGSTQLIAFEKAGTQLMRTAPACGFRWNSFVRKHYEPEIAEAKKIKLQRKQQKLKGTDKNIVTTSSLTRKSPEQITYLEQIIELANKQHIQLNNMIKQIDQLREQLQDKNNEIMKLKDQLEQNSGSPTEITVNEDYRTLLLILQRARQLGMIEGDREKHLFKMDARKY